MIPRLVVCAVVAGCVLPVGASAADSTISFNSTFAKAGVKVGAVAPARVAKGKVVLPVRAFAGAAVTHGGAIKLTKGQRSVTLSAPTVRSGPGRLTARVGKATVSVFAVDGAKLRLTVKGASAIRKALRLRRLAAGTVGSVVVAQRPSAGTPGAPPTTTTPAGGGGSTTPGGSTTTTTPTTPRGCPTATASGGPTALARPLSAVDVTAATITWRVRESFIQYINSGEGTSTCNGATSDPPSVQAGSSAALAYDFHFAFKDGWYDPVTQTARVTFTGTVNFSYADHGIALAAANPEIELNGGASRGIFTTSNTDVSPKRGILENLDPADPGATVTHAPPSHTYNKVPGSIPSDAGSSTFAGYYQAGDAFGSVSVALQTG